MRFYVILDYPYGIRASLALRFSLVRLPKGDREYLFRLIFFSHNYNLFLSHACSFWPLLAVPVESDALAAYAVPRAVLFFAGTGFLVPFPVDAYHLYTLFLPRLHCFVDTRTRLVLARLSENFFMSAHLGALCLLAAISFIFFPSGFLLDIFSP
jgi:hypothetical protein